MRSPIALLAACVVVPLLAFGASAASAAAPAPNGRIIGGKPTGESGWRGLWGASVVSIAWYWRDGEKTDRWVHSCSGVLIDRNLVLTARHCVGSDGWWYDRRDLRVTTTSHSLEWETALGGARVKHVVTTKDSAAEYSRLGGDLAVLVLGGRGVPSASPMPVATAEQAALWGGGAGLQTGAAIAGFGTFRDGDVAKEREFGPSSDTLRATDVAILDSERCAAALGHGWSADGHLCVGTPDDPATPEQEGRTACYGDSGGPLIVRTNDLPEDAIVSDRSAWDDPLLVGIGSRILGSTCRTGYSDYVNLAPRLGWLQAVRDRYRDGGLPAWTSTHEHLVRVTPLGRARTRARVSMSVAPPAGSTYSAQISYGSSWREIARFRSKQVVVSLPPSMEGKLLLRVRRIDELGELVAGKADSGKVVPTRRDATAPSRIARVTAVRRGVRHELRWSRARDNDRVVGYAIEQRRPGGRWESEYIEYCLRCETVGSERPATRSTHIMLPGRRQFRIAAMDRAGNYGPWTTSGVTAAGPNA